MTDNILRDLNAKIEMLDRSVSEMRMQVNKESSEMNDIANQMATLKSKYDMKKLSVMQMTKKLEEKTKILTEARNAYNKIVVNTTKLIEAVSNEAINDKIIVQFINTNLT